MKKLLKVIGIATLALAALPMVNAQTKKPMAKPMSCPVCKMPLMMKKDKTHMTAVRLKKGGPVMYCCNHCKMPASVLVKPKAKKMMAKKMTAK